MKKYTTFASIIALSTAMSATSVMVQAADKAAAQTTDKTAGQTTGKTTGKTKAEVAMEGNDFAIENIIVTAQKRSERLKDVPISMSVLSDVQLHQTGVRDLKSIAEYIPNLQISQSNDFRSTVTIRGVGAQSRNIGFDARVGVYVDGVYMGQSPALNQELLDIQRIEVLRGPQGTLFGKNTVAGAISITTKKPNDELAGRISADVGNLGFTDFKGRINIPLSDKVFAKFSVSRRDRNGYVRNTVTGHDLMGVGTTSYRAQLRFLVSDQLEINASFDGLNGNSLTLVGVPETDSFALYALNKKPQSRTVAFNRDPTDKRDVYGGHVDINYETSGGFTLKSITAYRDTKADYTNQTDYSPLDIVTIRFADRYKQFTEELQFISPSDQKLTYMAGLYYYNQRATTRRDAFIGKDLLKGYFGVLLPPGTPTAVMSGIRQALNFGTPGASATTNYGDVKTKSYAGYLNGAYQVTDRLKIGFGLRYSIEDKDVSWTLDGRASGRPLTIPASLAGLPGVDGKPIGTTITSTSIAGVNLYSPAAAAQLGPFIQLNGLAFNIGSTGPDPLNPSPMTNTRRDTYFAPAVSLTYALNDDDNVYVKYSSGYKSGGFNLDFINANELAANSGLKFAKETVKSYEIGFKGSFLDNRLSLNMAGFVANYNNYQVNQFVDLGGGRTSIRISNAAKVRTKGIEAEATWHATEDLTFNGSLGLLDATFSSFPHGGTKGADVSGNRLPNATTFNASFSAQYYHDITSIDTTLLVRFDLTTRSGYYTTANNNTTAPLRLGGTVPFDYIQPLTMINGRIGLISDNNGWEIYLWGRNLTDQKKYVDDLRDFFGTIARFPNLPRTTVLTLSIISRVADGNI
ncbi:MAG: TonB-dependent receptor [Alphaproteobacteria bacterium]|nr:TonB-dependent receptor [Alphaproteobacteria bacterium]